MPNAPRFPRSDHCDGRRFFNPRGHINRSWLDVLKWRLTGRATPWTPAPTAPAPAAPPETGHDQLVCTWINHATFLLRTAQASVLIDPVYSNCAGPFGRLGPRRAHPPGLPFNQLPALDLVLLTHDHYDHCDLPTLRRIAARHPARIVAPLGHARLLRRAGFAPERITELDWWETRRGPRDLTVTLTPARHWSNRLSGPRNGRLWGGFYLQTGRHRVHCVGDTGYDPEFFRDIGRRLGPPDLALVPIGAYAPRWFMAPMHCDPAEAVQIHRDLGARRSVAAHWGTFQLTDEDRLDPVTELQRARHAAGLSEEEFQVLQPGESLGLNGAQLH